MTEEQKKEKSPEEILECEVKGMSNRKLQNRLNRLRRSRSNSQAMWAILLSTVMESRTEPYLR